LRTQKIRRRTRRVNLARVNRETCPGIAIARVAHPHARDLVATTLVAPGEAPVDPPVRVEQLMQRGVTRRAVHHRRVETRLDDPLTVQEAGVELEIRPRGPDAVASPVLVALTNLRPGIGIMR